ncbi:unnamed protein product, partial [Iphiclides podalirius]
MLVFHVPHRTDARRSVAQGVSTMLTLRYPTYAIPAADVAYTVTCPVLAHGTVVPRPHVPGLRFDTQRYVIVVGARSDLSTPLYKALGIQWVDDVLLRRIHDPLGDTHLEASPHVLN